MSSYKVLLRSEYPEWADINAALVYGWDQDSDNREWRECVQSIITTLATILSVELRSCPEFLPHEDFVDRAG